jgi:hypothetical protein
MQLVRKLHKLKRFFAGFGQRLGGEGAGDNLKVSLALSICANVGVHKLPSLSGPVIGQSISKAMILSPWMVKLKSNESGLPGKLPVSVAVRTFLSSSSVRSVGSMVY